MTAASFFTSMTMTDGQVGNLLRGIEMFVQSVQPKAPTMAISNRFDCARLITQGSFTQAATRASFDV